MIKIGDTILNAEHVAAVCKSPAGDVTVEMVDIGPTPASDSQFSKKNPPGRFIFKGAEGARVWDYFVSIVARNLDQSARVNPA